MGKINCRYYISASSFMKQLPVCLILVTMLLFCATTLLAGSLKIESVTVEAPFEMPAISIPDFSGCPRFSIKELGAKFDNKESTSRAINEAVGKAHEAGGGVVVIPAGEWTCAQIHLKSNVNLHLDEGAVLRFSENPEDYLPAVKSTWEGMECYNYSPLIYAYECRNVAITGKGMLYAKLDVWKEWYARPDSHMEALKRLYNMAAKDVPLENRQMVGDQAHMRPQFIQFNRCENVLLEGVSIENSPFWVIHPFLSKNVIIRDVKVKAHGHNNDGVDPEMSQNVLIENCVFDQGDDAIAVKSGRNQDAWRLNTPTKNIVIRNCFVKEGHQLLAVGSELSGGIENILIENCHLDQHISSVRHLLFIKTNERRGGYVKNIFMRNISAGNISQGVLGIETDVLYQWKNLVPTYEVRLTPIQSIFIEDISVGNLKFIAKINGCTDLPVKNVALKNVKAGDVSAEPWKLHNIESMKKDGIVFKKIEKTKDDNRR